MSAEENVLLVKESIEALNSRDLDRYFELYAESFLHYSPARPEPRKGLAAGRKDIEEGMTAFPDTRLEVVRTFGYDDWVCLEMTSTGTHTGPLKGAGGETIPPTNKSVRLQVCIVLKFEGGKVTEEHEYYDQLGFMTQLGLTQ